MFMHRLHLNLEIRLNILMSECWMKIKTKSTLMTQHQSSSLFCKRRDYNVVCLSLPPLPQRPRFTPPIAELHCSSFPFLSNRKRWNLFVSVWFWWMLEKWEIEAMKRHWHQRKMRTILKRRKRKLKLVGHLKNDVGKKQFQERSFNFL